MRATRSTPRTSPSTSSTGAGCGPLPGAADLLRACAERGLDVVLASSASEEELAALCSAIDADDAITAATSASDADEGKPAPDIVETALEKSGLDAGRVVFVGDAVWDGHAAGQSHVTFVGVTCGGTPAADLREAGAVEVSAGSGGAARQFRQERPRRTARRGLTMPQQAWNKKRERQYEHIKEG